ncbi:hypothetical protein NESM_000488700 [Novymonas esmeraldas]|uniref:Uncharacterized protein n=1 Tax=Novymonas esmeraldas TaxID=1808958 RepID=A0AAW0EPF8_9TRYP
MMTLPCRRRVVATRVSLLTVLACVTVAVCCAHPAWLPKENLEELPVTPPPYDTETQDLVAPMLAMGLGPMGAGAYVLEPSSSSSISNVVACARADAGALLAPVTVTTIDALFASLAGVPTRLDVHHRCYLEDPHGDTPPQCVATLASTAADCGGAVEDAIGPHLAGADSSSNDGRAASGVLPTSAAVLAAYVRVWGPQRLRLERSLRRTREAVAAFTDVHALVQRAAAAASSGVAESETRLLLARATAQVATVATAAYDRVVEKYHVLDTWTTPSLGIVPASGPRRSEGGGGESDPSAVIGPDVVKCPVSSFVRRLLWGDEPLLTVVHDVMGLTLEMADSMHSKQLRPAVRGLECVQVLTALAVMALEDEAVRVVAGMVATGAMTSTSVWSLDDFALVAPDRNIGLRQRQLWSLSYAFGRVADPAVAGDLVGGVDVAECMRRAALVVPDAVLGTVPPSIYWCLYNTSMAEMAPTAVRRGSLATREDAAASSPSRTQCRWGWGEWDGRCGGAAAQLDRARCALCPPGSAGDGEGHCVCGNATALYATLTDGCVAKGPVHDAPGVRVLHSGGNDNPVVIAGDGAAPVALVSVQLPRTAAIGDPSAYLRVDVTCSDGGHGGGGTWLTATPSGDRRASCAAAVEYERQYERVGVRHTDDRSALHFITYAESMTISATATAAFYGETCAMTVTVGSTLRRTSRTVAAGSWTFMPGAMPLRLIAYSYVHTGSTAAAMASSAESPPPCEAALAARTDSAAAGAVHTGVCRVTDEQLGVFVAAQRYRLFGMATEMVAGARVRHSAGTPEDAAFTATALALSKRSTMRVYLEGDGAVATREILWAATLTPRTTPLAANAWHAVWYANVSADVWRRVRWVRVRVMDAESTSAFASVEEAVACRYDDTNNTDGGGVTSSASGSGDDHGGRVGEGGAVSTTAGRYGVGYVAAIAVVSVLLVALLCLFGLLFYLLSMTDKWPKKLLT